MAFQKHFRYYGNLIPSFKFYLHDNSLEFFHPLVCIHVNAYMYTTPQINAKSKSHLFLKWNLTLFKDASQENNETHLKVGGARGLEVPSAL